VLQDSSAEQLDTPGHTWSYLDTPRHPGHTWSHLDSPTYLDTPRHTWTHLDSAEQLDSITSTATAAAAESKRRRWREMPPHMRSCVVDPHDELVSWRRYATNNARQTCKRLGPAKE